MQRQSCKTEEKERKGGNAGEGESMHEEVPTALSNSRDRNTALRTRRPAIKGTESKQQKRNEGTPDKKAGI